ncbi:flagellar basal body rod protein FlgF [Alteromonas sp. S015]|uniref:flagellar basal body rod protein FlgF n=1 Tax=Alteromonas sp. S015 TaxID=3117401 RepID=UPI002FE3C075
MEKLIYTAVSGADLNQTALRISANNLANVNTAGFKSDLEQARSVLVSGQGFHTRYQAQMMPVSTDMSSGAPMETGRELDVLLGDNAMLSVSDEAGNVAYTRKGNLSVSADGVLLANGRPILNGNAEIVLPEFADIDIAEDGSVNVLPVGGGVTEQVARINLVSFENAAMVKGTDGLFRTSDGDVLPAQDDLKLKTGFLESSNVNAVEEMVKTMMIGREFEMNIKMISTAEELSESGDRLVRGNG